MGKVDGSAAFACADDASEDEFADEFASVFAADAAPSRKRPAASDDAATHAAKRPAPPPRCYCDRPAVRLGDRFVCPLPDTRNYCTFGREDRMRIVPRFGIPAALAPKPCN